MGRNNVKLHRIRHARRRNEAIHFTTSDAAEGELVANCIPGRLLFPRIIASDMISKTKHYHQQRQLHDNNINSSSNDDYNNSNNIYTNTIDTTTTTTTTTKSNANNNTHNNNNNFRS